MRTSGTVLIRRATKTAYIQSISRLNSMFKYCVFSSLLLGVIVIWGLTNFVGQNIPPILASTMYLVFAILYTLILTAFFAGTLSLFLGTPWIQPIHGRKKTDWSKYKRFYNYISNVLIVTIILLVLGGIIGKFGQFLLGWGIFTSFLIFVEAWAVGVALLLFLVCDVLYSRCYEKYPILSHSILDLTPSQWNVLLKIEKAMMNKFIIKWMRIPQFRDFYTNKLLDERPPKSLLIAMAKLDSIQCAYLAKLGLRHYKAFKQILRSKSQQTKLVTLVDKICEQRGSFIEAVQLWLDVNKEFYKYFVVKLIKNPRFFAEGITKLEEKDLQELEKKVLPKTIRPLRVRRIKVATVIALIISYFFLLIVVITYEHTRYIVRLSIDSEQSFILPLFSQIAFLLVFLLFLVVYWNSKAEKSKNLLVPKLSSEFTALSRKVHFNFAVLLSVLVIILYLLFGVFPHEIVIQIGRFILLCLVNGFYLFGIKLTMSKYSQYLLSEPQTQTNDKLVTILQRISNNLVSGSLIGFVLSVGTIVVNFAIASIGFEGLVVVLGPYKDIALIAFFITIFSGDAFGTSLLSDLRFYIVNLVLILFIIMGSIIGNEPFYTQLAKEYAKK